MKKIIKENSFKEFEEMKKNQEISFEI